MSRLVVAVSSLLVVAAVAAAPTASAPSSTAVIRLGVGIGKVRLGMSYSEVRRALGRPQLVNRLQDRGFGNRYVEYLWNYGDWRVGLLGPRGRERVVRVATAVRGERTPQRVGVGSTPRQLARAYRRRAECISRQYNAPDQGTWIVLRGPGSRMTAFALYRPRWDYGEPRPKTFVAEVMVQQAWITPISGRCTWDWTRD
jgi:hypothetical protein